MFNRNLIWLWRHTYILGCHRLDPKRPNFFGPCHYTSKSTPPKGHDGGKGEKGSCEPCQDESVPEQECGCETPVSRFPIFPECEETCSKAVPKPATACPSAVCPPPKQGPPCEPVCSSEPKKPVVCPPKSGMVNFMRMISLLVVLPAIVGLTAFIFMTHEEVHRPPFVPYPFMRIHNNVRKWPWNSTKSLFYNSHVNALADGYEFEEEGEASLTEKTDESADADDGEGELVNAEFKKEIKKEG